MRRIDSNHEFSYSLVSNYEKWLNSESDYNKFYSNSENAMTVDEFDLSRRLNFYAHLFKLSFPPEHEQDDTSLVLGRTFETALNALLIQDTLGFVSNKYDAYYVYLNDDYKTLIENRTKNPPEQQVKIKGVLPNGLNFIGYADEVYTNCIIDIKTTSNFNKANYDSSLQIALYLHFIDDYPVQRGFYQVTEFYRSKAAGKSNEFTMKDTFMIESQHITERQLIEFSQKCAEILKNVSLFEKDLDNYKAYFEQF